MLYLNNVPVKGDTFPNQETTLEITEEMFSTEKKQTEPEITIYFENDADLIHLQFLVSHIRDIYSDAKITLNMPYVPYSRSDRPMLNRTFALKALAEFINNMHFHKVVICEPHSDVSVALLHNVVVRYTTLPMALNVVKRIYNIQDHELEFMQKNDIFFICPDNGAEKRYCQQLHEMSETFTNVRTCTKERELRTGRIIRFKLADAQETDNIKHAIIIDDLCSRGGTFLLCAQALKERFPKIQRIDLVVTHCENNIYNGDIPTTDLISNVFISDSMRTKTSDKIIKSKV